MDLLLLTAEPHPDVVLPSLSLLAHTVRTAPPDVSSRWKQVARTY